MLCGWWVFHLHQATYNNLGSCQFEIFVHIEHSIDETPKLTNTKLGRFSACVREYRDFTNTPRLILIIMDPTEQARLRRERRQAKLKAEGPARLTRITSTQKSPDDSGKHLKQHHASPA